MDWVKLIHPETGHVAEVPGTSVAQHYLAGWRPLAEGEESQPEAPPPEPEPMTRAEAAKAAQAAAKTATKEQ